MTRQASIFLQEESHYREGFIPFQMHTQTFYSVYILKYYIVNEREAFWNKNWIRIQAVKHG